MNQDPLIGLVLGESYRVERKLGEGGMGAVYLASHTRVPRTFAVKVLHQAVEPTSEVYRRFRREAEISCRLRHRNIVEVTDFNVTPEGKPYFVMEHLDGEDFGERLERLGRLPLEQTARIIDQVTAALTVMHQQGVVHRDLKPQNIFLCREGERDDIVKLLDFGISKIEDAKSMLTGTRAMMGTPYYMSPEQADGASRTVTATTDVFSLGVVTYQALSGQLPFIADSLTKIIFQIAFQDPPPLRSVAPGLPEAVIAVVQQAMAKAPEQRFPSAAEFGRAFRDAYQNDSGPAVAFEATVAPATDSGGAFATGPAASVEGNQLDVGGVPVATTMSGAAAELAPSLPQTPSGFNGRGRVLAISGGGVGLVMAVFLVWFFGFRESDVGAPARVLPRTQPTIGSDAGQKPRARPVVTVKQAWLTVPEGCFTQGSLDGDKDERPPHKVCLSIFQVTKHEVSIREYRGCVDAGKCQTPQSYVDDAENWRSFCNFGAAGRENHPVNCVTWAQAQDFCTWKGGRLPTESEWEYVARGKEGRRFPWGSAVPTCDYAVMKNSTGLGCGSGRTMAVGSKPKGASPFGALDMAGNVWEWIYDCYSKKFYGQCTPPCENPNNQPCTSPRGKRITRGVSYGHGDAQDIKAFRASFRGTWQFDGISPRIGFRCIRPASFAGKPAKQDARSR